MTWIQHIKISQNYLVAENCCPHLFKSTENIWGDTTAGYYTEMYGQLCNAKKYNITAFLSEFQKL
jgi:hypothetical protein